MAELLKILTEAVHDLDADKLSEESFNSFRVILQIGMEVTKERRVLLMSATSATSVAPWQADEEVKKSLLGSRSQVVLDN